MIDGADAPDPARRRIRPGEPADAEVLELAGDMPRLAEVRRWTGDVLADLTDEEVADAKLVVSELVTNAYEHGQHPLHVRLRRTRNLIRVEVTDLSPRVPVIGRSSVRVTRGRGLLLVDRLCRRWGAVRNAVGKTVWAVLARPSEHPGAVPAD
ncbi:histidine kinase-like protein [Saccharothrix saharensis]|uniref:Histidine kinase-like protein n=1 Tax=Saccharothrix saharensis TaxID=571190 RepID=A0A543J8N2_9PSEU|nr:ATP-binding protein [Saccharothrix saharensis]TQM79182.1 histidine kinase-like protein [Saccharothrix saharensis]